MVNRTRTRERLGQIDSVGAFTYLPTSGLVSYYKLEDLNDSVGSKNLTNVGTTGTTTGKIGNSYDGGVSNSTKYLTNTTNLGINGGACTISAWIKINGNHTTGDHPLAVNEYSGSNGGAYVLNGIGFTQTNTAVVFSRLRAAIAWQDVSYTFTPGTTWHHYVYIYDGTTIRGYIDGVLVATGGASGNGATEVRNTGLSVLGSNYTSGHWFSGAVDEVGIWNRALTQEEITTIYNNGNGLTY